MNKTCAEAAADHGASVCASSKVARRHVQIQDAIEAIILEWRSAEASPRASSMGGESPRHLFEQTFPIDGRRREW
jgi:hypothetical protein